MNWFISTVLILSSAYFDAKGFYYAALMWDDKANFTPEKFFYSFLFFMVGILLYFASLRFIVLSGVVSSASQTLIWFFATIVGVSILSGEFKQWNMGQFIATFCIIVSMGYLLTRQ
ncbi:MAG: hypothetical protein K0U15_05050 [Proteobacteria bacterium]|nr:hypothetical protein [Pseudomonadota bacterium]MCH9758678.1 hypothetical protein [Pseudomonadota bacterium]